MAVSCSLQRHAIVAVVAAEEAEQLDDELRPGLQVGRLQQRLLGGGVERGDLRCR